MAFKHGTKARLLANGYDLSPWMREATLGLSADTAESTTWANDDGSPRTGKAYVAGLIDGTFSGNAVLDSTAGAGFEDATGIFEDALSGDVLLVHMPQGGAFGSPARAMLALANNVEIMTPVADVGAVNIGAQGRVATGGGIVLHDYMTEETADGNSATYDAGATGMPTTNGGIGVLQVTAKGGGAGTLTVKVQHSSDGSTWADLVTFAGVTTANQSERVEVAGTVNRYLRSLWTITGGTWHFHASFARQ